MKPRPARTRLDAFCLAHGLSNAYLSAATMLSPSTLVKMRAGSMEGKPRTWAALLPVLQRCTKERLTSMTFAGDPFPTPIETRYVLDRDRTRAA